MQVDHGMITDEWAVLTDGPGSKTAYTHQPAKQSERKHNSPCTLSQQCPIEVLNLEIARDPTLESQKSDCIPGTPCTKNSVDSRLQALGTDVAPFSLPGNYLAFASCRYTIAPASGAAIQVRPLLSTRAE